MINEVFKKCSELFLKSDVHVFSSPSGGVSGTGLGTPLLEGEKAPAYGVVSYVPEYAELTVVHLETGKKYKYENVSPFLADKLRFYERKKAYGRGWQILRRLKLKEE